MRTTLYGSFAAGVVLGLWACGGDDGGMTQPPPNGNTASMIEVVSGDNQSADRGSAVPQPLVVEVTDDQGVPVSGATVAWSVSGGDGLLSSGSTTTDAQGQTSVTITLGFVPGEVTVSASTSGVAQSASFTLTATNPGPLTVTVDMQGIAFRAPLGGDDITIKLGDTVEWVNRDAVQHTATSTSEPSGGASFDSGTMRQGETYTFTPRVEGSWTYLCEIHPVQMANARITVVQ